MVDARKRVTTAIRDYLARERISREQFAFRTKLGKSTVDKLLTGLFSDKTLAIVEGHTKLALRAMLEGAPDRPAMPDAVAEPASGSDQPSIAVLPFVSMGADASGIFRRRHGRGHHHRAVARPAPVRHRAQFHLHVQEPRGRRPADRAATRRALRAGRQCAAGGRKASHHGAADRCFDRDVHLWAEHYDGGIDDVFELQDRITARVVGAIMSPLMAAEIVRSRAKRPENLDAATNLDLSALAAVRAGHAREQRTGARLRRKRALQLDPNYAVVAGFGAWAYTLRVAQGWCENEGEERQRGIRLARTAIAKGADDPEALTMGGYAIAFLAEEFAEGLDAIQRAIALDPNGALALSHAGWARCYLGRASEAIGDLERVITPSPREATLFRVYAGLALAHLLLERFEEAVTWGRRALKSNPDFTPSFRPLIASLAHLGRIEEARALRTTVAHADAAFFDGDGKIDIQAIRETAADAGRPAHGRLAGFDARSA